MSKENKNICKYDSPEQYLGLFMYATFIVCTSFHGTVFSMFFEKPFVSVRLKDGKDSRVETLLSKCNVLDNLVSKVKDNNGFE